MDAARLENMVITFNYDIGARGIIVIFFFGVRKMRRKGLIHCVTTGSSLEGGYLQ